MSDDFGIFDESQHMFFGLSDPSAWIRESIESMLSSQVPDTDVESIAAYGEPKWLTLGRKKEDDPNKVIVTAFAVCFRATVRARTPRATEDLEATFTGCFKGLGGGSSEPSSRTWLDLHADAETAFDEEALQARFLEFRYA